MENKREYISESNLHIDGRNIPYQLFTAGCYLAEKNGFTEKELDKFMEENYALYQRINQVIALKQVCILFRHTNYSCGSLSDDLFSLKNELIAEIKEKYGYDFDEQFMENFPSEEEYQKSKNPPWLV